MTPQPDIEAIKQTLRYFVPLGRLGEVRIIRPSGSTSGFFFWHAEINEAAQLAAELDPQAKGVYVVINEIDPAILNGRDTLTVLFGDLTKDENILRRWQLLIDGDPKSAERGADDSATDDEKAPSYIVREAIYEFLAELGFPEPAFCDSGNGVHMLFAVDLPNDEESKQLVKSFLESLAKRFSTDQVGVDISVSNAARITKLYGTVARKGQDRPDRPHRLSKIQSVPDGGAEIVSKELIVKAIRELTAPAGVTLLDSEQSTGDEPSGLIGNLGDFTTSEPFEMPSDGARFTDGQKHYTLVKLAGYLRASGTTEVEIFEALSIFNRSRCGSAASSDHLAKIARWAAGQDVSVKMRDYINGSESLMDEQDEQKPSAFKIRTAAELVTEFPNLRPYVIHELLRRGETMNIISAPKFGKSWLVMGLVLCIACGLKWLGKFWTTKGKVLLVDNELHPETLASRLPRVAESIGLTLDDYQDRVCVVNLRGQLMDLKRLALEIVTLEPGSFDLIVLDAWYRLQPSGSDENKNGDVTALYNLLDSMASKIGAAFVCVHHSSKGNQSGKSVTDMGAGAGAQSRAPDVHLTMRAHEVDQAVVVESAIRSSAPMDPFVMRWQWPTWTVADDLDPKDLRQERPRKKTEAVDDGGMSPEAKQQERELTARQKVLEAYSTVRDGDTETRIRDAAGLNGRNFAPIHSALLRAKFIERCDVKRGNGATYAGHKITDAGLLELGQLGQQLGQLLSDLSHTTRTSAPPLGGTVCPSSSSGDLFGGRPA